jgi:hypothetical protein
VVCSLASSWLSRRERCAVVVVIWMFQEVLTYVAFKESVYGFRATFYLSSVHHRL